MSTVRRRVVKHVVLVAAVALPVLALAHPFIVQNEVEVEAGAYHVVQIGVPHGCSGSPTNIVRVKVPEGINLVRVEAKSGWKVSTTMRQVPDAEQYVTAEGQKLTEAVDEVTWTGGHLLDSEFDRFNLLVKMPNTPGVAVYFVINLTFDEGVHPEVRRFINLVEAKPRIRPLKAAAGEPQ